MFDIELLRAMATEKQGKGHHLEMALLMEATREIKALRKALYDADTGANFFHMYDESLYTT